MTAVELRRVRKVHPDGHVAVEGVDLSIADGECFVLVGPSGCGKTSVLRAIAGLDDPTSGEILLDGEPVGERRTHQRELAMLFQSAALYPHRTVRANLAFPLEMAKLRRREIDDRVADVASLLGIGDVLDRRPSQLSGGQRQRVAMGRALIRRPPLLLMDEPMSNLDAKLRTELRSELSRLLGAFGITTLYVTHDQVEALALGDRVAVMCAGRIVQTASPIELYDRPDDVFVAAFIGSPAMNLLAATVVDAGGHGAALRLGGQLLPCEWIGAHSGAEVHVGVRPEAFRLDPDGPLAVEVRSIEHLGHEQVVHATIDAASVVVGSAGERSVVDGPTELVARIEPTVAISPWKPVRLAVDEVHLFDVRTGARVTTATLPSGGPDRLVPV
jgi:multiple sugar transport system ATP-binding protein